MAKKEAVKAKKKGNSVYVNFSFIDSEAVFSVSDVVSYIETSFPKVKAIDVNIRNEDSNGY